MRRLRLWVVIGGYYAAACGLIINLEERPVADADSDTDTGTGTGTGTAADLDTDVDTDADTDTDADSDTDTATATDSGCSNVGGVDPTCPDDRFPCTQPTCSAGGRCFLDPLDELCDDGDPCTEDKCTAELSL